MFPIVRKTGYALLAVAGIGAGATDAEARVCRTTLGTMDITVNEPERGVPTGVKFGVGNAVPGAIVEVSRGGTGWHSRGRVPGPQTSRDGRRVTERPYVGQARVLSCS